MLVLVVSGIVLSSCQELSVEGSLLVSRIPLLCVSDYSCDWHCYIDMVCVSIWVVVVSLFQGVLVISYCK